MSKGFNLVCFFKETGSAGSTYHKIANGLAIKKVKMYKPTSVTQKVELNSKIPKNEANLLFDYGDYLLLDLNAPNPQTKDFPASVVIKRITGDLIKTNFWIVTDDCPNNKKEGKILSEIIDWFINELNPLLLAASYGYGLDQNIYESAVQKKDFSEDITKSGDTLYLSKELLTPEKTEKIMKLDAYSKVKKREGLRIDFAPFDLETYQEYHKKHPIDQENKTRYAVFEAMAH